MRYTVTHPCNVENVWPEVGPWIVQAMGGEASIFDVDYVQQGAKQGFMQIWTGRKDDSPEIEMVLVTEAIFYGGVKTLVLRWLSGRGSDNWLRDLPFLENWALNNGFERIQAWGRKAWEQKLKSFGYEHEYTVVGKFLERGLH